MHWAPFGSPATRRAILASLVYLIVSGLWIWMSDRLVERWFAIPGLTWNPQTVKGMLFVLATAVYVFTLHRSRSAMYSSPGGDGGGGPGGLPGRPLLIRRLSALLAEGREGVLMVLDVDGMRLVNDTRGAEAGDRILEAVAEALRTVAPPGAPAFRVEGDEFALLLPGHDLEAGHRMAARLREVLAGGGSGPQGGEAVTFCAGVVPVRRGMEPHEVLLLGQLLLRQAVNKGKDHLRPPVGDAELDGLRAVARWGHRLTGALQDGTLCLHYQPVVDLRSGRVVHAEALLRLPDGRGGVEPAASFLHAAEEFRLMPQIDRWCLERVVEELVHHPEVRLFVNLSGQSLRDPDQLAWIAARVRRAQAVADQMTFEITETAWAGDPDGLRRWMEEMRTLGCSFALDDLGHGFSSLSSFTNLPFSFVKIDGSFVVGIHQNPTNRVVVEAIIRIARAIGVQVVAEWVEDEAAVHTLRELEVDLGQGYFLGRPGPLAGLLAGFGPAGG